MTTARATPLWCSGALAGGVAVVALAACGQGSTGGALGPDATVDELAAEFAPCDSPPDFGLPAEDLIVETAGWLHVTGVVEADRDGDGERQTLPARVSVAADSTGGSPAGGMPAEGGTDVLAHASFWPGVDWALANGAEVWFALADPEAVDADNRVSFVLVILPDGRVFFPGQCQHDVLYEPLLDDFGSALDATLREAAGRVGDDLFSVLFSGHVQPRTETR